ncbi:MAG TPA: hypothetical protein VEK08_20105 [Planctomycetota bacterium]|nr:hypothetical protein [Planctomycetota bacterium]
MKWTRRKLLAAGALAVAGSLLPKTPAHAHRKERDPLAWISRHWPDLKRRIPVAACACEAWPFSGAATHGDYVLPEYLTSFGGRFFLRDDLPPDFSACGTVNRSGSEYLLAMWRSGPRAFWLLDQYVVFCAADSGRSVALTGERLKTALAKWDAGERHVIYSARGWYDPKQDRFKH